MKINEVRQRAEEYIRWDPVESTKKEIQSLLEAENWEELKERVIGRLTFGTAGKIKHISLCIGLRGKMGAGYRCMNDLVVMQTAQVKKLRYVDVVGNMSVSSRFLW